MYMWCRLYEDSYRLFIFLASPVVCDLKMMQKA